MTITSKNYIDEGRMPKSDWVGKDPLTCLSAFNWREFFEGGQMWLSQSWDP